MKTLILAFTLAMVAACSKKAAPASTNTTPTGGGDGSGSAAAEGTPCSMEIMLTCPDGQVDACTKTPAGDKHECVAK
jgi:hypothetical protein